MVNTRSTTSATASRTEGTATTATTCSHGTTGTTTNTWDATASSTSATGADTTLVTAAASAPPRPVTTTPPSANAPASVREVLARTAAPPPGASSTPAHAPRPAASTHGSTAATLTRNDSTRPRPPSRTSRSVCSSKARKLELLRAQQALLEKEVQLAASRIAILQEEDDLEEENDSVTSDKEERTRTWVESHQATLALTMQPYSGGDYDQAAPAGVQPPTGPDRTTTRTPPPRTSDDDLRRGYTGTAAHSTTYREFAPRVNNDVPLQERNDNSSPRNIDYRELAVAITAAAKSIQPAIAPRLPSELPTFSGASSDWLPFKTAYEETAGGLSEQENLARLRRSLKGAAREAAHCLFVGSTTTEEVLRLLTARFGRPDALVMGELEKLRSLPRLTEQPKDICAYSMKITNIVATIKALGKPYYLYNPEIVRSISERMPSALRYRYYDYVAERPDFEPELVKLEAFMTRMAERCSSFAPPETTAACDRRELQPVAPTRRPARVHLVTPPKPSTSGGHREDSVTCPVCEEEHRVADCQAFKKNAVNKRWDIAREKHLCFRCLRTRKFKHVCKTKMCGINNCKYSHHQLLHDPGYVAPNRAARRQEDEDTPVGTAIVTSTVTKNAEAATLLKIIPVRLSGPRGDMDTYALLDDGSTCTLIESDTAEKIGAAGPVEPFYIEGVAGAKIEAMESRRVQLDISGRYGKTTKYEISARTMPTLDLSPQRITQETLAGCKHLSDLPHDYFAGHQGAPTILIGQDNWPLLLTYETRRGERHQPVASLTDLGWVLHGARARTHNAVAVQRIHHICTTSEEDSNIERLIKEHFALESLGIEPRRSHTEEENRALVLLERHTRPLPAGGYETGLLWKEEDPQPPDSYGAAARRLQLLEKKLQRDPELQARYEKEVDNLLIKGYAEEAPKTKNKLTWYLPHFAVINPQKPEKVRLVHDAAARVSGKCLNDFLLPGPDLLQSLPGVLMRFRQRPIAVTGDIGEMFMRVTVREEDRDMQRFLWRSRSDVGPPKEYRMKSVIFGATSSPCTAIYIKDKNAELYREKYPTAANAIIRNHYVDDYLASYSNENEAVNVTNQINIIHSNANYFLGKWASNSRRVLAELAPGERRRGELALDPNKILGMKWNPEPDSLSFNVDAKKIPDDVLAAQRTPTKREALRTVMSIFDPLGLATPVTVQAKRILQDVWRSGIDWDDELPENEATAWCNWLQHAQRLAQLTVPRCYIRLDDAEVRELHTFVDASSSAYSAVLYWRVIDRDGRAHVSLIASKGKVAPISKLTSIPRLELQAAVMGCRLARTAAEEHDIKPTRRIFWTDSRTVLAWLRTGPRAYKPFVAHRVAEIMEETKTKEWRWVCTKHNVADDATRDTPADFDSNHRWFHGPQFLRLSEDEWPTEEPPTTTPTDTGEERVHVAVTPERLINALPDVRRFSNWLRLIRTTARVLQFIDKLRPQRCAAAYKRNKKNAEKDTTWRPIKKTLTKRNNEHCLIKNNNNMFINLPAEYIERAESVWVRAIQQEAFGDEINALRRGAPLPSTSRLIKLAIRLDDDGVLRLRSRVAAAGDITEEQRSPAVLDGQHPWARLYIAWVHRTTHHGGFAATTNEVRQRYWLLRLRCAVRGELKRCLPCRIQRATPPQPSTGDHPPSRLAHHRRAFTFTGLDYFGPLTVTIGRATHKRYGVLFTCLTTRAVHIELAGSLSTDAAIMALRRFMARRGCPTEIWSDNGTNLRGADIELRKSALEASQEEASVRAVRWRYIPPGAPFMGGAWERLVRSVKTALQVVLHERAPKEEVLITLLAEVEYTLNSRPLTHVSTDADDDDALTPNHFLLGGPARLPLPGAFTEGDAAGRKEWRASQRLADNFWARWVREYLPELQHRREPRASNGALRVGDLVLIVDGTLPRNVWPRGIIAATYPGPDGEVRAVDVKTKRGVLRRPTKKIVPLPVQSSGTRAEVQLQELRREECTEQ